jgi:hypothetical protein
MTINGLWSWVVVVIGHGVGIEYQNELRAQLTL